MPNFSLQTAQTPGLRYIVEGLPGSIAVGHFPAKIWPDWNGLHQVGFRHIVCLASTTPEERYHPGICDIRWLAKCDFPSPESLHQVLQYRKRHRHEPTLSPEHKAEFKLMTAHFDELQQIAHKMLSALWAGESVLVHCESGGDRSALLVGLVMVLSGTHSLEAVRLVCLGLNGADLLTKDLAEALYTLFFHYQTRPLFS